MRTQIGRIFASTLLIAACSSDQTADIVVQRAAKLPANATPVAAAVALGATPIAVSPRGVPRLVQGGKLVAAAPAATATASAMTLLERLAPAYGVRADAMPTLVGLGEIATGGGKIVRIEQVVDGMPVDHGELRVMVGDGGTLIAASGSLVAADAPKQRAAFTFDDAGAIARAVAHTHQVPATPALATQRTKASGGRVVGGTVGGIGVELAHAKQVWFPIEGTLVAAWMIEAYSSKPGSTDSEAFRTVISADGNRVLEHRSLQSDVAFKYRVFAETTGDFRPKDGPTADISPHPTGTPNGVAFPPYVAPSLVEVEGTNHNPMNLPDPWLLATATETNGNNVDAYADLVTPSGFTVGSDFRASTTGPLAFDRAYDTALAPGASQTQQMAAVTSAFYGINWLHDFWYDAGFNEAAGNAQLSNYGRGGEEADPIRAEVQDFSGTNNANMSTPRDGLNPRMQIYVWSGSETSSVTAGTLTPAVGFAAFGPGSFNVTAPLVLANDAAGVSPSDACDPMPATIAGQIVLADRGNCSFKTKARNIQLAGGAGMMMADNVASNTPPGLGNDAAITTVITIPSVGITMAVGTQLKTEIAAGATNATLQRTVGVNTDGALDSTLLAHEFGHYLHHRLQDCTTTLCGAISEGWGDFLSLMLLAREGDNLDGAYPFSVYTTQSFTDDAPYFGIRRAPYSTNTAINALSFRHMASMEPLPTTHPFLTFGTNNEVHNAGEIWATTMWEVYVALQKAGTSFETTRKNMAKYVVAGLLLAPIDGTPTETRDAILTAINAASPADQAVAATAFAKRGMGSCAISPAQDSTTFTGIVESSDVKGRAVIGAELLTAGTRCDEDDTLDPGETLKIKIPVSNRGHKMLTNIDATLTSNTPGLTVVTQPVGATTIAPYSTVDLEAEVKLEGTLEVPTAGNFDLSIKTADGCEEMVATKIALRMNVDDKADGGANDNFDTAGSTWTTATGSTVWTHARDTADVLDGYWHGDNSGATSDASVTSPVLTVGTGAFTVTFTHKFEFEPIGDNGELFDGGVVEITTDGGTTWRDVTDLGAAPGYTGTLEMGNPIGARPAYASTNPAHPQTDNVTLDFGTQLAGQTVQLRFRIGTDGAVGAPGWEVDNLVFTGIEGTPFPTTAVDSGVCTTMPDPDPDDDDDGGGCCDAGPIGAANIGAAFGVLALVLRRRRRRS